MRRVSHLVFAIAGTLISTNLACAQAPTPAQPAERHPLVPEGKTKVYDESADARQQIATALAAAKRDHTRVIIQWGGNWCPWCIRLAELMKSDKPIADSLAANYKLIHIDCGRPNGKNMDVARQYGAGGIEQFPYLTILDENGKPVINQDTRPFEMDLDKGYEAAIKAGHNPKMVLKFLEDNRSPESKADAAAKKSEPAKEPAAKAKIYREAADAKQQIAAAIASAKRDHSRVLIQWGGNWCPWCIKLHEMMKSNDDVAQELQYEYVVVHVDTGRPKGKNTDLAKGYQANVEKDGFPYLTVLDESGKPVANTDTSRFEFGPIEKGHDPVKVLDFLRKNQAAVTNAQAILDAGLAAAKKEGKAVFLHFGAPWCPWCHRLDHWMARPEVAAILAKDFVDVKIDTARFAGGKDLLKKFTGSEKTGIPWVAFMNGSGEVITDSFSKPNRDGNIGFPAEKEEIAHFEAMLKKAKKNMTDADVTALVEMLKNDKPGADAKGAGH